MFSAAAISGTVLLVVHTIALGLSCSASPTVQLDHGIFTGVAEGLTNKFLGIPFAKSPVDDLRFRFPVPNDPYDGTYNASAFGLSCPQQIPQSLDFPSGFPGLTGLFMELEEAISALNGTYSEDCLTLNVWAPANVPMNTKLPVIAYIFGGGFEVGGASMTDPIAIMNRSIELEQPVIFVSMNYRVASADTTCLCFGVILPLSVAAFGFLASKEVKEAGVANIGLQDQRQALRWIRKYISAFNGDPTRVVLWGASAGAISISLQMLANGGNTEGLFHGAFMNSGSPIPVGDITHGQKYYDTIVTQTSCAGAADTLQCLRSVPYDVLKQAQDNTPSIDSFQALNIVWSPRADGTFWPSGFQSLVSQGMTADIPFVTGDVDDEGTMFTVWDLNITTNAQFRQFLESNYLPNASLAEIDELLRLYTQDIAQGSPYGTGSANALTPEFKRLSSYHGDMVFQGPRRFFLQHTSNKQNTWSYLSKISKNAVPFGSSHGTDSLYWSTGQGMDYVINFANKLDPNGKTVPLWPKYTTSNPQLLTIYDNSTLLNITRDTYRLEAMQFLTQISLKFPL